MESVKFGVMLENLGATQLNYHVIKNVNDYLDKNYKSDIIVFFNNYSVPCLDVRFSCMDIREVVGFNHPVIATDLLTASQLSMFHGPTQRLFYNWSLEWKTNRNYEETSSVYQNSSLQLVTRNEQYARIISNCWNRKPDVIGDFEIEKICCLIKNF